MPGENELNQAVSGLLGRLGIHIGRGTQEKFRRLRVIREAVQQTMPDIDTASLHHDSVEIIGLHPVALREAEMNQSLLLDNINAALAEKLPGVPPLRRLEFIARPEDR